MAKGHRQKAVTTFMMSAEDNCWNCMLPALWEQLEKQPAARGGDRGHATLGLLSGRLLGTDRSDTV